MSLKIENYCRNSTNSKLDSNVIKCHDKATTTPNNHHGYEDDNKIIGTCQFMCPLKEIKMYVL